MDLVRHLLLVDDEALFLSSLDAGLSRLLPSTQIHLAFNGRAALEVLAAHPIDLVVTDLKMPEVDGFQLLATMHARYRHVPAIVMSAFGTPSIEKRVLARGAISYIDKPVDLHVLAQRITDVLDGHHIEGTLRGVSLPSLLQLLGMDRKTGVVRVRGVTGTARLYFRDGQIIHAEDGRDRGLEVALKTAALERVAIELTTGGPPPEQTIDLPISEILMEAARRRDELGPPAANHELDLDDLDDLFADLDRDRDRDDLPLNVVAPRTTTSDLLPAEVPASGPRASNVRQQLDRAMQLDGAVGAALVDYVEGQTLGTAGGGPHFDLDVAAAGNTEVVRAKMKTMRSLDLGDKIEDILITLGTHYHIIRWLERQPSLFLYLVVDRAQANLAMTRHRLAEIERALAV